MLRVPDGAASGNVLVTTDKGRSNSVYFEVLGGAGTKFFSEAQKYAVQYGVQLQRRRGRRATTASSSGCPG